MVNIVFYFCYKKIKIHNFSFNKFQCQHEITFLNIKHFKEKEIVCLYNSFPDLHLLINEFNPHCVVLYQKKIRYGIILVFCCSRQLMRQSLSSMCVKIHVSFRFILSPKLIISKMKPFFFLTFSLHYMRTKLAS